MKELRHTGSVAIVLASILGSARAAETASTTDWQLALLFNPSEQQLKVEDKGRVVIYDGLKSSDVEKAMEQEFDRIEHMMFIRTKVPSGTADYIEDDDGC
jgi:hypothetical protein